MLWLSVQKKLRIKKMEQSDKDLLIKDLCARLPYGVKLKVEHFDNPLSFVGYNTCFEIIVDGMTPIPVEVCKPYLFPMSSMTEELVKEFDSLTESVRIDGIKGFVCDGYVTPTICCKEVMDFNGDCYNVDTTLDDYLICIDWLNAQHFDFRNLIDRKLAIDATNLNIY